MSDLHIDDFFKDVAKILTQLYLSFPRKTTLYVEDLVGPDQVDEFGMHSDRHLACLGAMLWLAEEDYLRYDDTIRQEAVDQAVLTGRAFNLLNMPCEATLPLSEDLPESIRAERSTNVARVREALRSQSSARVRAVVGELLRQARSI
ncbi:MAG: hypothetical protein P8Y95_01305 [Gammaproteobacteria bacterium]|jgi:hypothetical protein